MHRLSPRRHHVLNGKRVDPPCEAGREGGGTCTSASFTISLTPEGFEAAEQRALEAGLPEGISLPIHAATPDHTTGMCIWEGESVETIRELVESVVGEYSENEYFELEVDGLPAK
jgi:hypothetical protein